MVDQTELTLIALLWLSLLRISTKAIVAPGLLSLELPLLVLHLTVLVLYNHGLVHQLLETSKGMGQQLVLETIIQTFHEHLLPLLIIFHFSRCVP